METELDTTPEPPLLSAIGLFQQRPNKPWTAEATVQVDIVCLLLIVLMFDTLTYAANTFTKASVNGQKFQFSHMLY